MFLIWILGKLLSHDVSSTSCSWRHEAVLDMSFVIQEIISLIKKKYQLSREKEKYINPNIRIYY